MKENVKTYFTFTRSESIGLALLLCVLLLLIATRFAMRYIAVTPLAEAQQNKLTTAWESRKHIEAVQTINADSLIADTLININTADSMTLLTLKGIGPKLTKRILEKRRELSSFKNYEQVWEAYHFSDETRNEILKKTKL